jgi:hypothetical protein
MQPDMMETEHLILDVCSQFSKEAPQNSFSAFAYINWLCSIGYFRSISGYAVDAYDKFPYVANQFNNRLLANGPDESLYANRSFWGHNITDILQGDANHLGFNAAWAWMEAHCVYINTRFNEYFNFEEEINPNEFSFFYYLISTESLLYIPEAHQNLHLWLDLNTNATAYIIYSEVI